MEYAVDCISSSVRRLRYQYLKDGYTTRGLENDYALGFIGGLSKKFEEQKMANQEWGLVLVKDKEVVEAHQYQINVPSILIQDTMDILVLPMVIRMGKFSISDKIAEGENEKQFVISGN